MSKINQITDSEKLFVELTQEEGAAVSGGAVTLVNGVDGFGVNYRRINQFVVPNPAADSLAPAGLAGSTDIHLFATSRWVLFDSQIGAGEQLIVQELEDGGTYTFNREGDFLVLRQGVANLTV